MKDSPIDWNTMIKVIVEYVGLVAKNIYKNT
jgi:hypothetical protein